MKSNALSILAAASEKQVLKLVKNLLSLLHPVKKSIAVFTPGQGNFSTNLQSICQGQATVIDGSTNYAEVQAKHDFVLSVALPSAPQSSELEAQAKALAQLKAPAVFLLEVDEKANLKDLLEKNYDLLNASGLYVVASLISGQKVSKATQDDFNCCYSKQDEAPLYFLENLEEATLDQTINTKALVAKLTQGECLAMTPGLFELELADRARAAKQRIVLAEGEEDRILKATDVLLSKNIADIILLGQESAIKDKAKALGLDISKACVINPKDAPQFEDYAHTFYELRKSKGVTEEDARKTMLDATAFGTMMVKKGDADGMVSGAVNTTAHTIRPALQFIKTKPGFSVVSSCFLMCLKDRVLVFGDCAVNPNPTAEQLAEIAIITAQTAKAFGVEPRVAMLSYSTGNSGKGPDVDLVIEATKLAKEKDPELVIDGPLQYDAAFDPTVAKTKLPNSPVAGKATVFIFPNLTCGNNTYKAVQRAANAIAIGPVLQGLNKPVNDLSRGCLVPDIINTVAITAVQAAQEKSGQ